MRPAATTGSRWVALLGLLAFVRVHSAALQPNDSPLPLFAMLSGDVNVSSMDKDRSSLKTNNTRVGLTLLKDNDQICKTETDSVVFKCYCFLLPGFYEIKQGDKTLDSFNLSLPPVNISMPMFHTALNNNVVLRLNSPMPLCSTDYRKAGFSLQIMYKSQTSWTLANFRILRAPRADLEELFSQRRVELSCADFDRAGVFKVRLIHQSTTSDRHLTIFAETNEMQVEWFADYRLIMRTDSIYPFCTTQNNFNMKLSFSRPSCPVNSDRIRLYAITRTSGNTVSQPMQLTYLAEKRLTIRDKSVTFHCSNFDIVNIGFCFKFVTALRDGLVREQATQCVPAENTKTPLDGGWSAWRQWRDCSADCGVGFRQRYRLCDEPEPRHYGAFCPGDAVQKQLCHKPPCPNTTTTSLPQLVSSAPCQCGCNISEPTTLVVQNLQCPTTPVWLLFPNQPDSHLKIRFNFVTVYLLPGDVLRIRDGLTAKGDLIYDSTEIASKNTFKFDVQTTSDQARVEFIGMDRPIADDQTESRISQWSGVVVEFTFIESPPTAIPKPGLFDFEQFSQIYLLIIISVLITFTSCLLVCLCLWRRTRHKIDENCRLIDSFLAETGKDADLDEDEAVSMEEGQNKRAPLAVRLRQIGSPSKTLRKEEKPLIKPGRLPEIPEDMQTSTRTESTRISTFSARSNDLAAAVPKKRSVGIQLTAAASPSLMRQTSLKSASNTPSLRRPFTAPSVGGNSKFESELSLNSSTGPEQDFEYDYYDFLATPEEGGFLAGNNLAMMTSEINIDEIIGDSELMKTPTVEEVSDQSEMTSVSTQIQLA